MFHDCITQIQQHYICHCGHREIHEQLLFTTCQQKSHCEDYPPPPLDQPVTQLMARGPRVMGCVVPYTVVKNCTPFPDWSTCMSCSNRCHNKKFKRADKLQSIDMDAFLWWLYRYLHVWAALCTCKLPSDPPAACRGRFSKSHMSCLSDVSETKVCLLTKWCIRNKSLFNVQMMY